MSVFNAILVIIALQLVTFVYVLGALVATHLRNSGARSRRLKRQWNGFFAEALRGRREAIAGIKRTLRRETDLETFHKFLDEQLRELRGGSPMFLRHLSRALGFTDRLQHQLECSRSELDRAAAAKTLGRLRERMAREEVAELLRSDDPAVVLAAGYASASFRDPRHFLPVLRAVYQRTPITLHGMAELLSGFDAGVCPIIQRIIDRLIEEYECERPPSSSGSLDRDHLVERNDVAAQVVMVDLLAFYGYAPAGPSLQRLLQLSEHEEVLIHLVKALAKIGFSPAVPRVAELLGHHNWVLRSQAAQALAMLDPSHAAPQIWSLLEDDNLQVRASAQRVLQSLEAEDQVVEAFA